MEYLIGAGVMWFIMACLFTWYQETYNNIIEFLIAFPLVILAFPYFTFIYPFYCFKKRKQKVIFSDTPSSPEGEFRFGEDD